MKEPMTGGKMSSKMSPANTARRTGDTPAAKKTVVSQAMINKIKADGMTAAIKKAAAGGAGSAYNEGVKRLYGASRVAKATAANMNAAAKPKAYGANNAPAYRPATAGVTKATSTKAAPKNPYGGFSMVARAVTQGSPKGPKEAAYRAAEAKRVATARAAEAARRAAAKKK
jgi:hypothetical protein